MRPRRCSIFQKDRSHTDSIEPLSDFDALEIPRQNVESAARADHDCGAIRLIGGWKVDVELWPTDVSEFDDPLTGDQFILRRGLIAFILLHQGRGYGDFSLGPEIKHHRICMKRDGNAAQGSEKRLSHWIVFSVM
ncbi:hypothetical protein [Crateriforma conspicua]|uniref:Uncharacterized protein n=1 Tax=Crateriforma conspicua TaxID=2527996 RepID=A0A5C6FNX2_9PLAN|nr:hypothetical protein [Crateriforma conspicua]TWU64619.1 hypothetical protein V7x_01630 [Crateriforma conspicua]